MKWTDMVVSVVGFLVVGSLVVGIGFYVKACDERTMACAERSYAACNAAGGQDCSLVSARLCGVAPAK